jgi:hypothetical protein
VQTTNAYLFQYMATPVMVVVKDVTTTAPQLLLMSLSAGADP